MKYRNLFTYGRIPILVMFSIILFLAGCNLGVSEQTTDLTPIPSSTPLVSSTGTSVSGVFPATVTPIPFPTRNVNNNPGTVPTRANNIPPVVVFPTSTPAPISIFILSPTNGNIVAGNIQILGSASHSQFLQYRLEYGPDPNPSNLWFPITGVVQTPVLSGTLGIWNTSTASTPDGLYQLRLRVFLRDGRQETTTVGNIRVQNSAPTPVPTSTPSVPLPIAAFTQNVTVGNAPVVINFTNRSQGQITTYTWFFGDGTTSTEVNPTKTYTRAGTYNVTLQVTGPGGSSNVSRQIIVTGINPPIASFDVSTVSGPAPLNVIFTNRSSGNINRYAWDFGDGRTSTQTSPTYTFNAVGTYNVILEAFGEGGSSRVVRQITVSNPAVPAPAINVAPSVTSGQLPLTVTFTNTTTNATQYLWDFNGDGITDSTETSPTHIFSVAGTFNVRLTAIGTGGQANRTTTITVTAPPNAPVTNFTLNPASGTAPLSVAFTNTSTGATSSAWDFNGDGTPDSTETSPSFNYTTPGTYTVRLTSTNAGGSTFLERTVTVLQPITAPTANFTPLTVNGITGDTVTFTNASSGDDLTYAWDFNGDGTTDSSDINPSFQYTTAGTFTVRLTATNSAGSNSATGTVTITDPIVINPPVGSFVVDPGITVDVNQVLTFTNTTAAGTFDSFAWNFDGGAVDNTTDSSPTFSYPSAGTYTVTLEVTNAGGSNTVSQNIVVEVPGSAPVSSFTANPTTIDEGGTVNFSIITDPATYTSFEWDFDGNGVIDDTANASTTFTYPSVGVFTASLTVSNADGSNTSTQTITVNAPVVTPPVASFTADPSTLDEGGSVNFAITTDPATYTSLSWDFNGDGTADDTTNTSASFTFATAGTYTASLTLTNAGGSNTSTQTITVNTPVVTPPVASFTADPSTLDEGGSVSFVITTDPATYDSLSWDFNGDGTADDTTNTSASFTFATAGTYTASLTLTNAGGSNTSTQTITVNAPAPIDRTFVYASGGEIFMMSDDGSNQLNITNNGSTDFQPQFSPDGSRIVFVSDRDGNNEIYIMDSTTYVTTRVTFNDASDIQPAWSNDGSQIVFVREDTTLGTNNIWRINTDGSGETQLTFSDGDEEQPTWANSQIVFVNYDSGTSDISIMNTDGSSIAPVASDPNFDESQPDFQDGVVVFISNETGNDEIWSINTDGSGKTQLTFNGSSESQPHWSRSDGTIVYITDGNISWMNADGSDQTIVLPGSYDSPDRK
jgi:PKD repeat protein